MIDSTTKELPDVLSTKHYAALTQLPLTYPWARLVLDMKELLLSFDRHLITCLIANQVQGNDPPHPGTVLSSFLHHLGQLILLNIAPHDTDDAPPFLQHPEIYGIEFWHAHLNYACTRFAVSHGPDRLLGNQICHWTTGTSETCMKVTHLVVFLPPALGAYVLSRHRTKVSSSLSSADDISMQDGPHTLRINQSALLTPPAVLKHQAEQITNARSRAAEGSLAPYTIPLLANTQVRSSKNRVAWTLQFREGTAPVGHRPLKGRCDMLVRSITSMKPPPFSPTLTFSPCLITLLNMALSGLKLWGCTSQIPLRNGCSQVPLASMTAQTLIFPATVKLLFLLSLNATFAANSRSLNLRNSLSPGRLKMKRYWIPLPRHAVK